MLSYDDWTSFPGRLGAVEANFLNTVEACDVIFDV